MKALHQSKNERKENPCLRTLSFVLRSSLFVKNSSRNRRSWGLSGKRDKVMIQLTKTCGTCCGKIGGKIGLFHKGKYFGSNPQICIQGWEQEVGKDE